MEGLLIWLGAKALVVAGIAALFVLVHLFGRAVLRRLPDGPLKRLLSARDDAHLDPVDASTPRKPGDGIPELLWFLAITGGGVLLVWAVYAYNTAY